MFLRRKAREREEKGPKALVPHFTRALETNPSKIAFVTYEILRTNPYHFHPPAITFYSRRLELGEPSYKKRHQ
jgi:hypothetical protein